jgi:hypothetical protein
MPLSGSLTAQIAKMLPRLASDFDGEVVATARALERILKSAGKDWHDLGAHITAPPIEIHLPARRQEKRRYSRQDWKQPQQAEDWRATARFIVVTIEWMKDGAEGDVIVSRLELVDLGADADGEPVTSCVIKPVEGEPIRQQTNRKLSDRQRLALDALAECATSRGQAPPATFGLPAGLLTVTANDWREELYRRDVLDRDAKSPREDFRRVKNSLQVRKLIRARDEFVWRA